MILENFYTGGLKQRQMAGVDLRLAFAVLDQISDGPLELWAGGPVFRDQPEESEVYVYGAGHVGRAVVQALVPLDWCITWVDARAGMMTEAPAGVACVETPLPESVAEQVGSEAMHLVMTHSHALDLEIVGAVLARPHRFCGLIGSAITSRNRRNKTRGPIRLARIETFLMTSPMGQSVPIQPEGGECIFFPISPSFRVNSNST